MISDLEPGRVSLELYIFFGNKWHRKNPCGTDRDCTGQDDVEKDHE